jgi:hypothetical protein
VRLSLERKKARPLYVFKSRFLEGGDEVMVEQEDWGSPVDGCISGLVRPQLI